MLASTRSAAAMALRGTFYRTSVSASNVTIAWISGSLTQLIDAAKPTTTAMVPFRAAAALSTSSKRDATSLTPHSGASGLAKARKEVPLGSEEGTKGVVQYALYVGQCLASPVPSD